MLARAYPTTSLRRGATLNFHPLPHILKRKTFNAKNSSFLRFSLRPLSQRRRPSRCRWHPAPQRFDQPDWTSCKSSFGEGRSPRTVRCTGGLSDDVMLPALVCGPRRRVGVGTVPARVIGRHVVVSWLARFGSAHNTIADGLGRACLGACRVRSSSGSADHVRLQISA